MVSAIYVVGSLGFGHLRVRQGLLKCGKLFRVFEIFQILLALEKLVGIDKLLETFDWMAGTSTGAVVAAAFSQGKFAFCSSVKFSTQFEDFSGRSLRDIQRLYFRLKDVVFDGLIRPYDSEIVEEFLKTELGEHATMGDIGRHPSGN